LRDALDDLDNIAEYADETGCPKPAENTVTTAKELLLWMHGQAPLYYGAGPAANGGITIDAQDGLGRAISMTVEPAGSITVVMFPQKGKALLRYNSGKALPYAEIEQRLLEFGRE
jgi:hypothetical protein